MSLAYWCVLVAAILHYATVGIAKTLGSYDNTNPRAAASYKGPALRAHSAHANGFEAFPLFAVAVLVASGASAKITIPVLDILAVSWIVTRLAYTAAYLGDRPSLRSLVWMVGVGISITIFTLPAWHR